MLTFVDRYIIITNEHFRSCANILGIASTKERRKGLDSALRASERDRLVTKARLAMDTGTGMS